ncbi:hypothetical protein DIKCMJMK_00329 [Shewanella oneidensis]|nr:hypothetical protein [Shewanella oneidensis]
MRIFTSKKLAYIVALVLTGALVGCGDDGKDGVDGAPGTPGIPGTPPPVTSSTMTNVKVINYSFGEGSITYEFEITDKNNNLINGLLNAQAKVAALTDKGFITNTAPKLIKMVSQITSILAVKQLKQLQVQS